MLPAICASSLWSFRLIGTDQQPAMGHLPTAEQQGKLFREEWRWLSLRAIAPRDGRAGTVHPCHVLAVEKIIPFEKNLFYTDKCFILCPAFDCVQFVCATETRLFLNVSPWWHRRGTRAEAEISKPLTQASRFCRQTYIQTNNQTDRQTHRTVYGVAPQLKTA